MASLGLLVLRLTLAVAFAAHGAHDLFGMFADAGVGPGGLSATASYFASIGLQPGTPVAMIAGAIELGGGVLIGVGLLTRGAAVALVGLLVIEIWKDYARWGFFMNWMVDGTRGHGVEYAMTLCGALTCLLLAGAGEWSLDGRRANSAAARAAGRARLRERA
jgi:putative oxidoreductase